MKENRYSLPEEQNSALVGEPTISTKRVADSFEYDWKRSIGIEEFRMQCKNKLKKMYE